MQSVPITIQVVSSIPARARSTRYNICDKVCQWLATGQWFSPGIAVSSTNRTDHHDIAKILLKVASPNTKHQRNMTKLIFKTLVEDVFSKVLSRLFYHSRYIKFYNVSWSWSYGSWIYNYLCNQCLSPLKLCVQIPLMARCTRYNIMW